MGLEVLGILHEQAGIDNRDEGFCREVSAGAWRVSCENLELLREGRGGRLRLFPLQSGEIGLDVGVLNKLGLDVIVNVLQLLLQILYQLPEGPVSPVPTLVPLEGPQVMVGGLWRSDCQQGDMESRGQVNSYCH